MIIKKVGPLNIDFLLNPEVYHEELYLNDFFKNEEAFYTNLIGKYENPIVFDVGSNIGYFTCLFKSCGSKEVHSFEPVEGPFQMSKDRLTGLIGVYLNNFALYESKKGLKDMYISKKHNQGSTLSKRIVNKFKGVFKYESDEILITKVNTDTLDNYCVKHKVNKIHLLKLDTEGTEYNILKGSKRMISNGLIENIVYESYNQTSRISSLLENYGYEIVKIDNLTTPMFHAKLKR
jgi:FkbM family methyltransferase